MLMNSLLVWYRENPKGWELVKDVNAGESILSCRSLDWFATNWSKEHNICYRTKDGRNINAYYKYRTVLGEYSKYYFDPFRRKTPLYFDGHDWVTDDPSRMIEANKTALCQLNFFRWLFVDEVIDRVLLHHNEIVVDMQIKQQQQKHDNTGGEEKPRKKRRALSRIDPRSAFVYSNAAPISFSRALIRSKCRKTFLPN